MHGYYWVHPRCGHRIELTTDPAHDLAVSEPLLESLKLPKPGEPGNPLKSYCNPANRQWVYDNIDPNAVLEQPTVRHRPTHNGTFLYGGHEVTDNPNVAPNTVTHPDRNKDYNLDPEAAIQAGRLNDREQYDSFINLGWPHLAQQCPTCYREQLQAEFDATSEQMHFAATHGGDWVAKVKDLAVALRKNERTNRPMPLTLRPNLPQDDRAMNSPSLARTQPRTNANHTRNNSGFGTPDAPIAPRGHFNRVNDTSSPHPGHLPMNSSVAPPGPRWNQARQDPAEASMRFGMSRLNMGDSDSGSGSSGNGVLLPQSNQNNHQMYPKTIPTGPKASRAIPIIAPPGFDQKPSPIGRPVRAGILGSPAPFRAALGQSPSWFNTNNNGHSHPSPRGYEKNDHFRGGRIRNPIEDSMDLTDEMADEVDSLVSEHDGGVRI